ncbi:MAG: GFA family protein [Pararhizobium sp.]
MDVLGGCLCGNVRYRATGKPLNSRICHCRQCQKATGAAFNARILYPGDRVTFSGEFATTHSSDDLVRGFCASCGTSVFTHRLSTDWIGVTVGSLDDTSQFAPEAHTWVSEKQQWLVIADGLPQFERMPPVATR